MTDLLEINATPLTLQWEVLKDHASLSNGKSVNWTGSLLPSFLIGSKDQISYCKAKAISIEKLANENEFEVRLQLPGFGTGSLEVHLKEDGLAIHNLRVEWSSGEIPIHSMYFGASPLPEDRALSSGLTDRDWFPDWKAWGYCVPSAKPAPIQSFFRCFDLGNCSIPLGSFGPAMGAPYAAAYPRPVLSAALGNDGGWVCFGAGEIPDAAMTLCIEASNGCLEWRYREDLWGGPSGSRFWESPLEITLALSAYEAFDAYFSRFPIKRRLDRSVNNFDFWGTWGEFKEETYDLSTFVENAKKTICPEVIEIDDGWETWVSSGIARKERFPNFDQEVEETKKKGFQIGLWQSLGWVDVPEECNLTADDLVCSAKGTPIQVNWQIDPRTRWKRHYCPDISSSKARDYIHSRTTNMVKKYKPYMIKFDFTYGLPGPDQAVPRDPQYRGERYAWHLLRMGSEAAAQHPETRIYTYSIHPLYHLHSDFVALDDLGDCGPYEAQGHAQWSLWASLLGKRGFPICASSGYDWDADAEILLNSAIIGAPGANTRLDKGFSQRNISLRAAYHRWFRKPNQWKPLWLNSYSGGIVRDIELKSIGRVETHKKESILTALSLRDGPVTSPDYPFLDHLSWTGRWSIISQDDRSISDSESTVFIPVDGGTLTCDILKWNTIKKVWRTHEETISINKENGSFQLDCPQDDSWNDFLGYILTA